MGKRRVAYSAWVLVLVLSCVARADVKLPAVFGDHMVLQRDVPLAVWGWADPGEKVTVTLGEQSKTATAGQDGRWKIKLDPLPAGGPHVLKVQGKNTLERSDVLVGEVWLCSGQSNMAMTVGSCRNQEAEIAAAQLPADPHAHGRPASRPRSRRTTARPSGRCAAPRRSAASRPRATSSAASCTSNLDVPVGLIALVVGRHADPGLDQRASPSSRLPELAPLVGEL